MRCVPALRSVCGLCIGAAAAPLSGCNSDALGKQLPSYRYRLTAEVETPRGIATGASVIQVQWKLAPKIMGSQGSGSHKVRGQAVAVGLPRGQTLFILLRSAADSEWVTVQSNGYEPTLPIEAQDSTARTVPRTLTISGQAVDNYPIFVRFRDNGNPHTMEIVDPDNLAASFGPGIRLKSLTVALTGAPAVADLPNRLPWLRDRSIGFYKAARDPATGRLIYTPTDRRVHQLDYRDFVREEM
jgi:hypothetical protein